jgi:hypothetical protein
MCPHFWALTLQLRAGIELSLWAMARHFPLLTETLLGIQQLSNDRDLLKSFYGLKL